MDVLKVKISLILVNDSSANMITKDQTIGKTIKEGIVKSSKLRRANPIEGKFGQTKTAEGFDRIKAKLANTSESWIASIYNSSAKLDQFGRASTVLSKNYTF